MRDRRWIGVAAACALLLLAGLGAVLTPLVLGWRAAGAQGAHAGALARGMADIPLGPAQTLPRRTALVIGHRGASAYRAEHTLPSYRLAVALGADFIETDLVSTADGVLVGRHENELSTTTDVASHPEFAARRTVKRVDGARMNGWFAEDFTLAELKTLRATDRRARPATGTAPGGAGSPVPPDEAVPTLQEIINTARDAGAARHRPVGLCLELKATGYLAAHGLALEKPLAAALRDNGLDGASAPVFVESFDASSLKRVHALIDVPLIQLLGGAGPPGDVTTSHEALAEIHTYAAGIGVDRARLLTPPTPVAVADATADAAPPASGHAGGSPPPMGTGSPVSAIDGVDASPPAPAIGPYRNLVDMAHDEGLEVHVFTFANDSVHHPLPSAGYRRGDPPGWADALAEYRSYLAIGVDGIITNNPDAAVRART